MKTPHDSFLRDTTVTGLLALALLTLTNVSIAQSSNNNQPITAVQIQARQNAEKLAEARTKRKEAFPKGRHDMKDKKTRERFVRQLKEAEDAHMEAVRAQAELRGLKLEGEKANGGNFRLIDFDEKGAPIYEDTMNVDAAITTAADQVRDDPIYQAATKIEAEVAYPDNHGGIQVETTSDVGGGQNIGYIENGDWAEYTIDVPAAGQYSLNIRTASNNNDGGTINLSAGGSSIGSVIVPDTNGWQSWTTTRTLVTFTTAGSQTLRMDFVGGTGSLFNVNWFSYNPAVIIGHWESGTARLTHQELSGKVSIWDSTSYTTNHATHVAGTLVARGINPDTLGMAPDATLAAFSSTNAESEMMANAAAAPSTTQISISNHSYGVTKGWRYNDVNDVWQWKGEYTDGGDQADFYDEDFGRYRDRSVEWDNITYNNPYYVMFVSAGNGRENVPSTGDEWEYTITDNFTKTITVPSYDPAIHPLGNRYYTGDNNGYDTMEGGTLAKNSIAVGSSDEGISGGVRDPGSATAQSYSCRGPADDGRIKPDIHANGTGLTSSIASSDTATASYGGTSMSSPNACGSAALLISYYSARFPGQAMRASTLKALILHTADDRGKDGPDYKYGWGVMNTKAAADVIQLHADGTGGGHMLESIINDTTTTSESHTFDWDGTSPLRVTICWTDPASDEIEGHNNRTKALVNDLNLKVIGPDGTHYPYVMPYVGDWSTSKFETKATTGVNDVDNVEQVYVATPTAGTYTVTVDYVGALTNNEQDYSLIITGQIETNDSKNLLVTTSGDDVTPPTYSTTDLAQTQYLSSAATGDYESAEHAQLFNGTIGNDDGVVTDSGEVQLDSSNTITVTLDTSINTAGYDITGIDTIFGWNTGRGGRSNQGYEIILTYVDNSTATLAGPEHWEPNSPATFWTKVSFADEDGGVLQSDAIILNGSTSAGTGVTATGVKAVTFDISENANAGSYIVAREFDIFGYPTGGSSLTELEQWRLQNFGSSEGTGDFADDADFDHDGNSNLVEFAMATDPTTANIAPTTFTDNASTIDLTYSRNVDAMVDYDFQVEWNDDLTNAAGWFNTDVTELILSDDGSVQSVKATAPKDSSAQRFFQLSITPK